jgi:hypothetical protein
MNRSLYLALCVCAWTPSVAAATTQVAISSDRQAQVFYDGRLVGAAPLTLEQVPAGEHFLRLESQCGKVLQYQLNVPYEPVCARTAIDARFAGESPFLAVATAVPPVVVASPVVIVSPGWHRRHRHYRHYRRFPYGRGW